MIIDLNYRVDILKGIVSQNAEHPLYYDDQNAHRVNVSLYRGQEEIDLSGLSCNGYVVFVKEGASIGPLTGEVSNNTCSVVLPHEAYRHPGAIRVEIKLIDGDSVTTVLMLTGHVSSGRGDRVIDIAGSIVPSLDSLKATIEELEERVAEIVISDAAELGTKVSIISRGHGKNLITLEDFTEVYGGGTTYAVDTENQTVTVTSTSGAYRCLQTSSNWVQSHLIPGHTYRLHAKSERVSGAPTIRVVFRGLQTNADSIAEWIRLSDDRNGGDGFCDCTIDAYTKRISLFITMSATPAASVTFSDIWLVDVTDETVRYDTTKTAILDGSGNVDWGWVPGEQTVTVAGVTVTRNGNRVKLNGVSTGNFFVRMVGNLLTTTSAPTAAQRIAGCNTIMGHEYHYQFRLMSGSATLNTAHSAEHTIAVGPYKSNSTDSFPAHLTQRIEDEGWILRVFTSDDGSDLSVWLWCAKETTYSNAEYELTLLDVTAAEQTDYATTMAKAALTAKLGALPVEAYGKPGSVQTGNKVRVSKSWGNRVRVDAVGSSGTAMVSIQNGVSYVGTWTPNDSMVEYELDAGHTYKFTVQYISGTAALAGTTESELLLLLKGSSQSAPIGTQFTTTIISDINNGITEWERVRSFSEPTKIGFGFYFRQLTADALIFEFLCEDVTDSNNIAPADRSTAASTHAVGDLLTVNGALYKATQAIAPGTAITPGTNVAETTVAAQLAERDTVIAAETAAREKEINAIEGSAADALSVKAYGPQFTGTDNGVTITKSGRRVTLNGTKTGGAFRCVSVTNGLVATNNDSPTANHVNQDAVLYAGRTYEIWFRVISGTYSQSSNKCGVWMFTYDGTTPHSPAISSDLLATINSGGYASIRRTFTTDMRVGFGLYFRTGCSFSNLVIEYGVQDITNELPDAPSSDGTYTLQVTVTNGVPAYSWIAT